MRRMNLTAAVLALFVSILPAQDKTSAQFGARPALQEPLPPSLPTELRFRGQHSLTFKLENGQYTNYDSLQGQPPGQKRVLTVERFTPESVILHRTDYGNYPSTATYSGPTGDNGNSLSGDGWEITWGAALEILPKSDVDAQQRLIANIPCDASTLVPTQQAAERAESLIEASNPAKATCWLRIAAKQGDSEAQGVLAAILYKGIGVPVNLPEAAVWAQKASAQNYYLGERVLYLMYESGQGKPKDSAKAEYWRAKAQQDKLASVMAEQEEQEQARQRAVAQGRQNAQAGFTMLGLLLRAFSTDSDSSQSSGPDGLDRYNGLKDACGLGDSQACNQIGAPPPE